VPESGIVARRRTLQEGFERRGPQAADARSDA
jgi:hypothetical protein